MNYGIISQWWNVLFACWFHFLFHSQCFNIYFVQIYVFIDRTFQNHSMCSLSNLCSDFIFGLAICLCGLLWKMREKSQQTCIHAHKSQPLPHTWHSINLVAFNWTTTTTTTAYNLKQRIACSICWSRLELAQWECNLLRYKFTTIVEITKNKMLHTISTGNVDLFEYVFLSVCLCMFFPLILKSKWNRNKQVLQMQK